MRYKLTITLIDGSEVVASDLVVRRQGSSAYDAIIHGKDVIMVDVYGNKTIIPFHAIDSVLVSDVDGSDSGVVLYDNSVSVSAGDRLSLDPTIKLIVGEEYTVLFNNNKYELTAVGTEDYAYIGSEDQSFSRYPFTIRYYFYASDYTELISSISLTDSRLMVTGPTLDHNWVILFPDSFEYTAGTRKKSSIVVSESEDCCPLPGDLCKVVVNGTSYELTAYECTGSGELSSGVAVGGEDANEYDFYINFINNGTEDYGIYFKHNIYSEDTTVSLTVYHADDDGGGR